VRSTSRGPGQPGGLAAGPASRIRTGPSALAAPLGATPAAGDVPAQAAAPGPKPSPVPKGRHLEHTTQLGAISRTRQVIMDGSVRPPDAPRVGIWNMDATDDLRVA
jgi:hypothetical protein